ncbi:hypothetical protein BDW02DRAFT_582500 [Decorospora gaudefroyi]|uniref:Uncharacterized protein n=1 Tax=Decorospora gaudefroyi TaxID=184978 RepID=A0A6A5K913_9PLEO|nr:hypothetical protein BDW02DRAFT_582500 [Decorospora gaudefroyi]
MRPLLSAIIALMAPTVVSALTVRLQRCRDEVCNDCFDSWSTFPSEWGMCIDTYDGEIKSARLSNDNDEDGSVTILYYAASTGTDGGCNYDTSQCAGTGSNGGCAGFFHPDGRWVPQMYFREGPYCSPF